MSKIQFDGPEPKVTRSPSAFRSTLPDDVRRQYSYLPPKPASDVEMGPSSPQQREVPSSKRLRNSGNDEEDGAADDDHEIKADDIEEELKLLTEIEDDAPDPAAHQKLDLLLNRKFAVIFRKIQAIEGRLDRIESLFRSGVQTDDAYWGFGNPRDLKPLNRYYSMIDKLYAMCMDAVKFNRGMLREKAPPKSSVVGDKW